MLKDINNRKIQDKLNNYASDVVIAGYYGCNNAGDEAMLDSIISGLRRKMPQIVINVISGDINKTFERFNVNAVKRYRYLKLRKAIKNTKLLIFGGGNIFQNTTSSRSLLYYIFLISLAYKSKRKIMLLGNGIGPISGKKYLKKIQKHLNMVNVITLRDKESEDFLISNGISKPLIRITTDPVYSLNTADLEKHDTKNMKCIGVSLRDWPHIDLSTLTTFFDFLISKKGFSITFIPMQPHRDLTVIYKVMSKMTNKATILKESISHLELLKEFNNFDFVIGMRLHSLIFSAIYEKPFIGIEYDPKISVLVKEFEQSSFGRPEDFNINSLIKIFNEFILNFESYKKNIHINLEKNMVLSNDNTEIAIKLLEES
jgi:polysaccharide pyruvyl transferase CsaB